MNSRRVVVRSGYGGAVVIGRNVGAAPMSETAWRLFIREVVALVEAHGGVVHTVANGVGEWDGALEDSGVVVFGGPLVELLHADLARLAARYGQDCVAAVGGDNWLIPSSEAEGRVSQTTAQSLEG
jgi:hypothetical protein